MERVDLRKGPLETQLFTKMPERLERFKNLFFRRRPFWMMWCSSNCVSWHDAEALSSCSVWVGEVGTR